MFHAEMHLGSCGKYMVWYIQTRSVERLATMEVQNADCHMIHRDFRSFKEVLSGQFKCMNTGKQKYDVWQFVVSTAGICS